jgi:hypothetical protein
MSQYYIKNLKLLCNFNLGKLYPCLPENLRTIKSIDKKYACILNEQGEECLIDLTDKHSIKVYEGIQRKDLISLLEKQKGFFSVSFIKKDGTNRKMVCKFNVKKHLKTENTKPTVDLTRYFVVWSIQDKGYRAVNKETILEASFRGKNYIVE